MITFHSLLKAYDINPQQVRLVRHANKQMHILDAFQNNRERLTQYSSWQSENKFSNSKYLAMFSPARGTTALFLGIWSIDGVTLNSNLDNTHVNLLSKNNLPKDWIHTDVNYNLKFTDLMNDLSERLIIEWGGSTVSWVQVRDKNIVQIKPRNSIGDFVSYDDIQLSFSDLKKLVKDSDSNASWVNALSSVNGVYLIIDKATGGLYVGSAYGRGGVLARWSTYSRSGHGDNKLLKELNPEFFEFSILEICPSTMSADEVIHRENRWKVRLGSREFGLNCN